MKADKQTVGIGLPMLTYRDYQAVLNGGETNMTPSPLTKRKGTVRLVVCKIGSGNSIIHQKKKLLQY